MEVLNLEKSIVSDLGGQSLIQTVVSLTELPEPLVHQEIDQILQASGHQSESLTLEQLRAAMISYLEAMQADFEASDDALTDENDANQSKTPVILE
jgi:hypothetical protein